ncbi:MAG: antitoxin [Candidatus Marinimicrobia bacterium]|jgi:antitoxin VapB|nr:antitoxin [Candidatus Neomarinimicrobiota bacterium]
METAKIFTNGRSQAIRLPKKYRFEGKEVFIKKEGNAIILIPQENPWNDMVKSLDLFTDDFMCDRDQPLVETREVL